MALQSLVELIKDMRAFGVTAPLAWTTRALRRHGEMMLRHPAFGAIRIRCGDSDYAVVRQVFRDRQYEIDIERIERQLHEKAKALAAAGRTPVIVDAGANIGASAIWFSRRFPAAAVVAVEPDAASAGLLRDNVAPYRRVIVAEAAIGGARGFAAVATPSGRAWMATTERAEGGCPIITVPDAVRLVPNGAPFLVKVDIEGFERDLFTGDLGWIDRTAAIYIEPHDWLFVGQATSRAFQRAMGARDFELHVRGENLIYVNQRMLDAVSAPRLVAE